MRCSRHIHRLSGILFLAALLLAATWAMAAEPRIVAVGDIHGDYDAFTAILQEARVIDPNLHWIAGHDTLVQLGDMLDRGAQGRQVMDLLMTLQKEASKKGGRAVVLLGNHEVMNLVGDLRYATPESYAQYANAKSQEVRTSAYRKYVEWSKQRAKALHQPPAPEPEAQWMQEHPLGFIEQRELFAPNGKYGQWLRDLPATANIGSVLFLHGGISPTFSSQNAASINQEIRSEIQAFDSYTNYLEEKGIILPFFTLPEVTAAAEAELKKPGLSDTEEEKALLGFLQYPQLAFMRADGPLWFRGYAQWTDAEGGEKIAAILHKEGVEHIVAGHTPEPKGQIKSRFGGSVFLIDTGMLSSVYTDGQASALEIRDGKFTAIYRNQRVVLLDSTPPHSQQAFGTVKLLPGGGEAAAQATAQTPAGPHWEKFYIGPDGKPLPFKNDDQVLDFLRTAQIVSSKSLGEGTTAPKKLMLEKDGVKADAIFRYVDADVQEVGMPIHDTYANEPAAYELGRLLGIDNLYPAVMRKIEGKAGSVQLWVENTMTETKRKEKKLAQPNPPRWNRQIEMMYLWDALINNVDRNTGNLLIDSKWNVWYIDHTRAFQIQTDLRDPKMITACEQHVWEQLQHVSDAEIRSKMEPFLRKSEIDSLLKRREKLVAFVQELIHKKGESKVLFKWTDLGGNPGYTVVFPD